MYVPSYLTFTIATSGFALILCTLFYLSTEANKGKNWFRFSSVPLGITIGSTLLTTFTHMTPENAFFVLTILLVAPFYWIKPLSIQPHPTNP